MTQILLNDFFRTETVEIFSVNAILNEINKTTCLSLCEQWTIIKNRWLTTLDPLLFLSQKKEEK